MSSDCGIIGGSGGATMWAAIQVAKELDEDKRMVVIIPDGVRNYMYDIPLFLKPGLLDIRPCRRASEQYRSWGYYYCFSPD